MRSAIADKILARTPEDVKIFIRLYTDIVVRINQLLKERGQSQRDLARQLEKSPSEINKWLNGEHNFTLRSIAKLEAELGESILYVPKKKEFSCSNGGRKLQYTVYKPSGVETLDQNYKAIIEINKEFIHQNAS